MDLGGAMFWAMDLDDFTGNKCDQGKFPLINTAKDIVNGDGSFTRPTTQPTTTVPPLDQSDTARFYCVPCKKKTLKMKAIEYYEFIYLFFSS